MSYIGLPPALQLYKKADFTGDGATTSFNIVDPVTSVNALLVIVGGVIQEPTASYTIETSPFANTLEFTSAPANGVDIYAIWLGSPNADDIDLSTFLRDIDLLTFLRTNETATLSAGFFDTMNTLTDAANISWDWADSNIAQVTITADRILDNPTSLGVGSFSLKVIQDGTGGWQLTYGAAYKWPDGIVPVLASGAGDVNILSFVSDGTNVYGTAITGMA